MGLTASYPNRTPPWISECLKPSRIAWELQIVYSTPHALLSESANIVYENSLILLRLSIEMTDNRPGYKSRPLITL